LEHGTWNLELALHSIDDGRPGTDEIGPGPGVRWGVWGLWIIKKLELLNMTATTMPKKEIKIKRIMY